MKSFGLIFCPTQIIANNTLYVYNVHTWTSSCNHVHVYMHVGAGVHIRVVVPDPRNTRLQTSKAKGNMAPMIKKKNLTTRYAHTVHI